MEYDMRRTRERAIEEWMRLYGLDRVTAEAAITKFVAALEDTVMNGIAPPGSPAPRGIFTSNKH